MDLKRFAVDIWHGKEILCLVTSDNAQGREWLVGRGTHHSDTSHISGHDNSLWKEVRPLRRATIEDIKFLYPKCHFQFQKRIYDMVESIVDPEKELELLMLI